VTSILFGSSSSAGNVQATADAKPLNVNVISAINNAAGMNSTFDSSKPLYAGNQHIEVTPSRMNVEPRMATSQAATNSFFDESGGRAPIHQCMPNSKSYSHYACKF
jgi:hypothetical protein